MEKRLLAHLESCRQQPGAAADLIALGGLLNSAGAAVSPEEKPRPHFAPKAKRIIYLFQSGAPSRMDLFDLKPQRESRRGEDLPGEIRKGQRLTGMTSGQKMFPVAPSIIRFAQHGQRGMQFSHLMPHMSRLADDWCMIRSMHTEAINHDPAIPFFQTGSQLAGRPSLGSWISYRLGNVGDQGAGA